MVGGIWAFAWATKSPQETLGEAFANRLASVFGQEMPSPSPGGGGMQLPPGITLGGAFSLTDHTGRDVTERDFAGRWLLLYFGFTHCPDVCPTDLGIIADTIDLLGPLGEEVTPVLISIDPERDTPAQLADYVAAFHPRMVGLTGTPQQVSAVARRFRVFYSRVQHPDMTEYTMDHSSFIYLVGPDGLVRSLFRRGTAPEAITAVVRGQLRAAGRTGA